MFYILELKTFLLQLEANLDLYRISFLRGGKTPKLCRKRCYLHLSEGGLVMSSVGIRIMFLDQMCSQAGANGEF